MRPALRHHLLRSALIALTALDVLGLSAFLFNHGLGVHHPQAWVLAGVLTVSAAPMLTALVDRVFAAAAVFETIPFVGDKIPEAGQ